MKRTFLASFLLFASASFSHHGVVSTLENGDYLGAGYYHTTTAEHGEYHTYSSIKDNVWHTNLLLDNGEYSFHHDTSFTFKEDGFFDVLVVDHEEGINEDGTTFHQDYYYSGAGYCMSAQCHYSVDFGDKGIAEETITFHHWNNKIYRLGSHSYVDKEGTIQKVIYEETLNSIESDAQPCNTHE